MKYLVGDLQGCGDALRRLLVQIDFSASRDHLFVLGDLVNRGPDNLSTLQQLHDLQASASCLLGNHDLHFLAVAHRVRPLHRSDTVGDILDSPQRDAWVEWVRQRPLAMFAEGWLMVHAGVLPQWDRQQTLSLAQEVETRLRGTDLQDFLHVMYGNEPAHWDDSLHGNDRLRLVVNTLTRARFLTADGSLEFGTKDAPGGQDDGLIPWFDFAPRRTLGQPVAFGHWSALGLIDRPDLIALDTGCVWGGALSAMRIDGGRRELFQVDCATQRDASS